MIDRYKAIAAILTHAVNDDLVLSTTGMISREAFATLDRPGNFYMIGSMGLLSSFGLGLAVLTPQRRVFVLEGDGSALMSLGALPLIAAERPRQSGPTSFWITRHTSPQGPNRPSVAT